MMQQHSGRSLERISKQDFLALSDRFSELPMYFLKFFGSTDVNKVRCGDGYEDGHVHVHVYMWVGICICWSCISLYPS